MIAWDARFPPNSMPARSARALVAPIALGLLAACASRTGADRGPSTPRRPTVDLRLPAEDGLILSVLGTGIRTAWADLDEATRARFDEAEWDAARVSLEGRADRLTYASGGHRVGALLVRPGATGGRRLPVVLLCRDGVGAEGLAPEALLVELEAWSREGYVALASAYRGNQLSQGDDEAASPADVLALVPLVGELDYADPDRVYLLGRGQGGVRALRALAASEHVRAAAIVDAPLAGAGDAAGVTEPVLVVAGQGGGAASLSRARALTDALAAAGAGPELHVVAEGDPNTRPASAAVDERVAAWFAAHGGRSFLN